MKTKKWGCSWNTFDRMSENDQAHSLIAVFVSRTIFEAFNLKRLGGSQVAFDKCFDFWEREWWGRER